MFLKNTTIPVSWIYLNKVTEPSDVCSQACDLPYVVAVNVHDSEVCSSKCTSQFKTFVSVKDFMLKVVSIAFLLVCFLSLKESTCETKKNVFYFTSKALFVLEKIKF